FRGVGFGEYLARIRRDAPKFDNRPEVAVVVAEGDIISGPQKPGSIGGAETARLIRAARENKQVKAIVLRVNSPGGAVYPAELIRREVQLARAAGKPVVASMGNVAASGGYWISMDANQIVAEPDTITGSIGIFGLYYNIPDTLAKIGIHTGGLGTTPWAGAFDITRPLDPKLGATIQQIIDHGYMQFVGGVAKARGKTFEQINAIAQGRVWTGRQAVARGLVDKLGGIDTAIALAAQDARLGKNYRVHYISEPMSPLQRALMGFGDSALASIAIHHGFTLPPWMASFAPRVAGPLQMLQNAQPGKVNAYAYCFCGQ
ncbi:signal peptide peptidase SppA, partial [Metallibacterium scheffleri]